MKSGTRLAVSFVRTCPVALLVGFAHGGVATAQTIEGTVVELGSERPIENADVSALDTAGAAVASAITDADGRFRLHIPSAGAYFLRVRSFGYFETMNGPFQLEEGDYLPLRAYLRPEPIRVDSISVEVESDRRLRRLEMEGFYRRRQMGFGHFRGPQELEERLIMAVHDLFRGIPGVTTVDGPFGDEVYCNSGRPTIFVDNIRLGRVILLDDYVDVDHVSAIEVYTRISEIPLQYGGMGVWCVVLVWTGR